MSLDHGGGSRSSKCAVCGTADRDLIDLTLETRVVTLCRRHAARAREANARTFSDLRRLFVESGGNRSLLARRDDEQRRTWSGQSEGLSLGQRGRRRDDPPKR